MILTVLLSIILAILGLLLLWIGTIPAISIGLTWFNIAISYYNTFLDVVPFLRLPFTLFVSGILLEIFLLVLKMFLGSRSPMNSSSMLN